MEAIGTSEFMPWIFGGTALAFLWGACIGSFLNVCIHRIPRDLSVVRPRSFCPTCGRMIPAWLNLPILSYLMLLGKCAYCKVPIRPRYMLVELLTAVLFLLVWLKLPLLDWGQLLHLAPMDQPWLVLIYWIFISGLLVGTFIDFEYMIIPDIITCGGAAAGLVLSTLLPALHGMDSAGAGFVASLKGLAVGGGILWLVSAIGSWMFRKDAMGQGDVKLLAAIGAFLGWQAVLFTLVISSFVGAAAGLMQMAVGGRERAGRIPFGPYLSFAAILWVFWGPQLLQCYFDLLTPAVRFP